MDITILKNSTTIEIINDEKFNYRRDGGIDTVEIHFYSKDNNLLNKFDKILLDEKIWRVSKQPTVKVNYINSPEWLYTVILAESIIILDGIPLPNFTFTQDLNATKTIDTAIREALKNQADLKTTETQTFTLKTVPSIDLSDIAPNDKFENKTLYDILVYYGSLLDARPTLNEDTNEIDYVYLNDDNGVVLVEGNQIDEITTIEISKDIEDYSTDLIEDAENVVLANSEDEEAESYPMFQELIYTLPLDLNEDVSYENMNIELPHKILKVKKLTAYAGLSSSNVKIFSSEPDGVSVTKQLMFEEQEWNTLKNGTFFSFIPLEIWDALRTSAMYYKYGDNKIYNIGQALNYWFVAVSAKEILITIEYVPLPDVQIYHSSENLIDGDYKYTKRIQQQNSTLQLESEYERLKIQNTNNQSYYYNITVTTDSVPSKRSKIRVNGNDLLISEMTAQKIGDKYELNIKAPTEFNAKNPLTKAINQNRIFTIPNTQTTKRKHIETIKAKFYMDLNSVTGSTGKWVDYNYNLFFGLNGKRFDRSVENMYYNGSILTFAEIKHGDDTLIAVGLPQIKAIQGDTVILVTTMTSNTSCDWQRYRDFGVAQTATAQTAIVVDENGEFEEITFKYIILSMDDITAEDDTSAYLDYLSTYPFVDETFYTNGTKLPGWEVSNITYWNANGTAEGTYDVIGGATETDSSYLPSPDDITDIDVAGRVTATDGSIGYYKAVITEQNELKHDFPIWDSYKLNKDSREQIQFENRFEISSDDNLVIDTKQLFDNFTISKFATAPTIETKINGVWVSANNEVSTFYPTNLRISFKYTADGTLTGIRYINRYNNNVVMTKTIASQTVANGESAYIDISIKEE